MKLQIIMLSVILLCSSCTLMPKSQAPTLPKSTAWFEDKDIIELSYRREHWQSLSCLASSLEPYRTEDFRTGASENGGQTRNFVRTSFKVTPKTIELYHSLHKTLMSLGFSEQANSPKVMAYKISPEGKTKAQQEFKDCNLEIIRKLQALFPELKGLDDRCVGKKGITYTYRTSSDNYGINLIIHDISKDKGYHPPPNSPELSIHLPHIGYFLEVYITLYDLAAKKNLRIKEKSILKVFKEAYAPIVKNDPQAIVYPPEFKNFPMEYGGRKNPHPDTFIGDSPIKDGVPLVSWLGGKDKIELVSLYTVFIENNNHRTRILNSVCVNSKADDWHYALSHYSKGTIYLKDGRKVGFEMYNSGIKVGGILFALPSRKRNLDR